MDQLLLRKRLESLVDQRLPNRVEKNCPVVAQRPVPIPNDGESIPAGHLCDPTIRVRRISVVLHAGTGTPTLPNSGDDESAFTAGHPLVQPPATCGMKATSSPSPRTVDSGAMNWLTAICTR
ncbi:Uncharacterised protein [Mycobacterium tuberculosis]|nr:Uncharacterised protein [Mycobacterium tuberculosis]